MFQRPGLRLQTRSLFLMWNLLAGLVIRWVKTGHPCGMVGRIRTRGGMTILRIGGFRDGAEINRGNLDRLRGNLSWRGRGVGTRIAARLAVYAFAGDRDGADNQHTDQPNHDCDEDRHDLDQSISGDDSAT